MTELIQRDLFARIRPALVSLGVLREIGYRIYMILQIISLAGSMLVSVVQGYIVAQLTHGAPMPVMVIWFCSIGPLALFSPFIGHFIDRWDKRRVLQITSALAVIQTSFLGYMLNHGLATVPRMDLMSLALGLITAVDGTARQAIIPLTIEKISNIKPASALFTCLYSIGQVFGPIIAGPLHAIFHNYGQIFYVNAVSYLPLIIFLPLIQLIKHSGLGASKEKKAGAIRNFLDGAKYTFTHKKIKTLLILSGILCMFNFLPMALLSVASIEMFHAKDDVSICGYLSAAFGFGGGIGAFLVFFLSSDLPFRKLLAGGALVGSFGLIGFAETRNLHTAFVMIFLAGLGSMTCFSCVRSTIMELSHRSDYTKNASVISFVMSFMGFGILAGFLGGGELAKHIGSAYTFGLFGIALTVLGIGSLWLHPELSVHKDPVVV